jgi:hypothetical protein
MNYSVEGGRVQQAGARDREEGLFRAGREAGVVEVNRFRFSFGQTQIALVVISYPWLSTYTGLFPVFPFECSKASRPLPFRHPLGTSNPLLYDARLQRSNFFYAAPSGQLRSWLRSPIFRLLAYL